MQALERTVAAVGSLEGLEVEDKKERGVVGVSFFIPVTGSVVVVPIFTLVVQGFVVEDVVLGARCTTIARTQEDCSQLFTKLRRH